MPTIAPIAATRIQRVSYLPPDPGGKRKERQKCQWGGKEESSASTMNQQLQHRQQKDSLDPGENKEAAGVRD